MEIHRRLQRLAFGLTQQDDRFHVPGSLAGVEPQQGAHALAKALNVLALAEQRMEGPGHFPAIRRLRPLVMQHGAVLRLHMVGADALVGEHALAHEIGKRIHVTRGLPDRRVHDDGGIQPQHILALPRHRPPPGFAQIALQISPQWAVVPEATNPAVDFR